jgi:hypothetical protein
MTASPEESARPVRAPSGTGRFVPSLPRRARLLLMSSQKASRRHCRDGLLRVTAAQHVAHRSHLLDDREQAAGMPNASSGTSRPKGYVDTDHLKPVADMVASYKRRVTALGLSSYTPFDVTLNDTYT